jgi:hypothetical protein
LVLTKKMDGYILLPFVESSRCFHGMVFVYGSCRKRDLASDSIVMMMCCFFTQIESDFFQ